MQNSVHNILDSQPVDVEMWAEISWLSIFVPVHKEGNMTLNKAWRSLDTLLLKQDLSTWSKELSGLYLGEIVKMSLTKQKTVWLANASHLVMLFFLSSSL